jgi:soluble lytic murein transglycosylase-like protein
MLGAVERQRVSTKRQPELARFARPLQDQAACPPLPTKDLNQIVQESAAEQQLDPVLVQNVVRKESAGWPCAVSPKGAQGLMQLMPETAEMLGVQNPFDPKENVVAGTRLLKALMDRYGGNAPLALAAYNAGPKRVNEAGGIPEIPETQEYVRTIMDRVNATPTPNRIPTR